MTRAFNKIFRDRELLQDMLTKRDNGWSATALALEFNCDGGAIVYRCKQHGVKPNKITFGKKQWVALNVAQRIEKIQTPNREKVISDSIQEFRQEFRQDLRDEQGQRINKGKPYKEYIKDEKDKIK